MNRIQPTVPPLRAYECTVGEWSRVFYATTAGKARYQYLLHLQDGWEDARFQDIKVRSLGLAGAVDHTTDQMRRTFEYRGIPFARAGMLVTLHDGRQGRIVGTNSSANLDVVVDGITLNCHPNCEITYHDETGAVIRSFRAEARKPAGVPVFSAPLAPNSEPRGEAEEAFAVPAHRENSNAS